jgi:hypothetical protein
MRLSANVADIKILSQLRKNQIMRQTWENWDFQAITVPGTLAMVEHIGVQYLSKAKAFLQVFHDIYYFIVTEHRGSKCFGHIVDT